ncbi:MAG: sigma-70 family RNA polymerase sigma factor [Chloroflexota bacterium]|nr:sigma-70 family RNA polymerase sigma factor [Chloroflexota bacterium]
METLPLAALVRLCQETLPEDTRAFEELVSRFSVRVYATAYRLLGNRQDAEDQAQEVFIKVYRGIRQLDDPELAAAWVYRLTANTCLDELRKRQRAAHRTSAPLIDSAEEDGPVYIDRAMPGPEEVALRRELRECLEDTLLRLEPAERAVLVLRDVEGRPYDEVADALSVGLGAVKMRIHRARLAFQQLFARLCGELAEPPPSVRRGGT